jgi:hypothetical protein
MKWLLCILLTTLSFQVQAQTKKPLQHQIQLQIGPSMHSTGDMDGFSFSAEYGKYFKQRLSYSFSFGGSIHSGVNPLFFKDPSTGQTVDGSIRYTTAGFQTGGYLGYSFVRTLHHEFQVKMGALLRYQSSSYYDEYSVIGTPVTGLPIPVLYFVNKTPQNTYAAAGNLQLGYNYTFKHGIFLGFLAGFQADTNEDNILQTSFMIGKRF